MSLHVKRAFAQCASNNDNHLNISNIFTAQFVIHWQRANLLFKIGLMFTYVFMLPFYNSLQYKKYNFKPSSSDADV